MIADIGYVMLVAAMGLAILQSYPSKKATGLIVLLCFACIAISFASLLYSHVVSDFSVRNVFENSHQTKPLIYKISGTWGNHEGSMLMLVLVIAAFNLVFSWRGACEEQLKQRVLNVQAAILLGFLAFIVFTSNPFERITPTPPAGMGLNPLLQDIGLALHPPLLYVGYIGFSMAFSFAFAGLLSGKVDKHWAKALSGWVLFSWAFLTLGIGLGSWWAYRELGWGGYWFWDPVENASLMPWLIGTALMHCLLILRKRETLKIWTILLALLTFAMSLIGIFLVRSGVLTSVHAFANSPERGMFILGFIAVVIGSSFALFAAKAHILKPKDSFSAVSRETMILINNALLTISCATVLLGTLYPLAAEVLTDTSISVGAPYFNNTVVPLLLPLLILAGIGPLFKWHRDTLRHHLKTLLIPSIIALISIITVFFMWGENSLWVMSAVTFSIWLMVSVVTNLLKQSHFFAKSMPFSYIGMVLAHLGIAILTLGVGVSAGWSIEKELIMKQNDTVTLGDYNVTFKKMTLNAGKNYISRSAEFTVSTKESNNIVALLQPEVRFYPVEQSNTTEAALYYSLLSNVYIAIGDASDDGGTAARLYYKPWVNFIWLGCLLMTFGGLLPLLAKKK